MKPQFKIGRRKEFWTVDVFYIADGFRSGAFPELEIEETFNESTYQKMAKWCSDNFKTWLKPRRARRMSYTQFWFKSKKDLDWFVLYWSGVDILDE